jgi:hypothetical protein
VQIDFPEMVALAPAGLIIELGVAGGNTFNFLCQSARPRLVYGFDWFHGLPEAWPPDSGGPGLFSQEGKPPAIEANGRLIIGKVEDTLKPFMAQHQEPVALAHFDMDLYGPTRYALDALHFQPGSILAFDESDGQERCSNNEQRAFWEWLNATGHRIKFLGRRHYTSWVIQVRE